MLVNDLSYNARTGRFSKLDGTPLIIESITAHTFTPVGAPSESVFLANVIWERLHDGDTNVVAYLKVSSPEHYPEVFYPNDPRYEQFGAGRLRYFSDHTFETFKLIAPLALETKWANAPIQFFGYDDIYDFMDVVYRAQKLGKLVHKSIMYSGRSDDSGTVTIKLVGDVLGALCYRKRAMLDVLKTMQMWFTDEVFTFKYVEGDLTKNDFERFDLLSIKIRNYRKV